MPPPPPPPHQAPPAATEVALDDDGTSNPNVSVVAIAHVVKLLFAPNTPRDNLPGHRVDLSGMFHV